MIWSTEPPLWGPAGSPDRFIWITGVPKWASIRALIRSSREGPPPAGGSMGSAAPRKEGMGPGPAERSRCGAGPTLVVSGVRWA